MARFIQHDDPAAPMAKTVELDILETNGKFTWSYSSTRVIRVKLGMSIEIKLKNYTDAKASILDYASTGVHGPHSPISLFTLGKDQQSATFTIDLFARQLIDFGVFVKIEKSGSPDVILFCDPQASNDPIKDPLNPP
jgi:hypothetical protein